MQYDKGEWTPRPVDVVFPKLAGARELALEMKVCIQCAGEAEFFADYLSERDYQITGLCQTCQDRIYQEVEEKLSAEA